MKEIKKDKNSENIPQLDITEVVLVHCILLNSTYQHDSKILHTFISNKLFGHLVTDDFTNRFHIFKNIYLSIFIYSSMIC